MSGILLIDSHPLLLEGLNQILTTSGRSVAAKCQNIEDAYDYLKSHHVELIISEAVFRNTSGIDLLKSLRIRGDMTPLIIYAAHMSPAISRDAIESGANAIILKDSDTDSFMRCLETVEGGQNWIDRTVMNRAMQADLGPQAWKTLSPAEQKIASLAGQGLRNLEIAQQTGLAEGTVKVHLNRIFRKLGIASRMKLVSAYSEMEEARK